VGFRRRQSGLKRRRYRSSSTQVVEWVPLAAEASQLFSQLLQKRRQPGDSTQRLSKQRHEAPASTDLQQLQQSARTGLRQPQWLSRRSSHRLHKPLELVAERSSRAGVQNRARTAQTSETTRWRASPPQAGRRRISRVDQNTASRWLSRTATYMHCKWQH
jgi:hypothetical protein